MKRTCNESKLALLAPLPAVLIGAWVMHRAGIGPVVYGQNLLCYALMCIVVLVFKKQMPRKAQNVRMAEILLGICVALLALTFVDAGLSGVHRWLRIGGLRLYASAIFLPCMIYLLGLRLREEGNALPLVMIVGAAAILFLQPDAAQLSGFAVASLVLLASRRARSVPQYAVMLLLAAGTILAWIFPDSLDAVAHVEDILPLAFEQGFLWGLLGLGSLLLLPLPFFCGAGQKGNAAMALGVYFAVVLLSTFFGNFPVPFMGYGISPIFGYMLALLFPEADEK